MLEDGGPAPTLPHGACGMAEPTSKQLASSALLQELQAAQDIIQQLQVCPVRSTMRFCSTLVVLPDLVVHSILMSCCRG